MLNIFYKKGLFYTDNLSLKFGKQKNNKRYLDVNEVLFLLDIRNANLVNMDKKTLLKMIDPIEYFSFKDCKKRGLSISKKIKKTTLNKEYLRIQPINILGYHLDLINAKTYFIGFKDIDAMELYERYWFGQYGEYKSSSKGNLVKYNLYEAKYFVENKIIKEQQINVDTNLYNIYKYWRNRGYVLKTGFKFGTHFRVYLPGASPIKKQHSKFLLHVLSGDSKVYVFDFFKTIRLSQSVRKEFILAVNNKTKSKSKLKYLVSTKKHNYLLFPLHESQHIKINTLISALNYATSLGYNLLISVVDDDTSITYYKMEKIFLGKKLFYKITWVQP